VAAQQAIEAVYWRHRLWPAENKAPKPQLASMLPPAEIEAKVARYLDESNALATVAHRPITPSQLQAELDRMVRDTRDPKLLQELFDALHSNATLIAETLVRQTLVARLAASWLPEDRIQHSSMQIDTALRDYVLPALPSSSCVGDIWSPTHTELPDGRATIWPSGPAPR
jgi:hypothetical protein